MRHIDIDSLAAKYVGNWKRFESFGWNAPDDADNCAIVNVVSRDSSIVDRSNAQVIERELAPYLNAGDGHIETHSANHWACGWVEGYLVRVYDADGKATKAFIKLMELLTFIAEEYPILDEEHYSAMLHDEIVSYMESNDMDVNDDAAYEQARQSVEAY